MPVLTCSKAFLDLLLTRVCLLHVLNAPQGVARCAYCSGGFYANVDPGLAPAANTPGATACLACPAGTYSMPSSAGTGDCLACPINTYAQRPGMRACDACPTGQHTCTYGAAQCTIYPCTSPLPPNPPPRSPSPPPLSPPVRRA